jgi:hypothetical protein
MELLMSPEYIIHKRYCGPPGSGNGGYSCGLLAAAVGGDAEVRLQAPPPLDVPLSLQRNGTEEARMLFGEQVVASARRRLLDLPQAPAFPGLLAARKAMEGYAGWQAHAFPTCFVCGTDRAPGDGLRIFPGALPGGAVLAAAWTPAPEFADDDGNVRTEFIWAALDCPSGWAWISETGRPAVLGTMAVRRLAPVPGADPTALVAWRRGREGRKLRSGSALYDRAGRLCAFAEAIWIELPI